MGTEQPTKCLYPSVTEGEIARIKLVKAPQEFITDRIKAVVLTRFLLPVLVSVFR